MLGSSGVHGPARRGWDRSTLQMTEDACDHRLLGEGGNEAE